MKFTIIPSQLKKDFQLKPWNRFYMSIMAVKNDKAKRSTK